MNDNFLFKGSALYPSKGTLSHAGEYVNNQVTSLDWLTCQNRQMNLNYLYRLDLPIVLARKDKDMYITLQHSLYPVISVLIDTVILKVWIM